MNRNRRHEAGLTLVELMKIAIARSSDFRAPVGARSRYARGLTLVELMIAIALMLIMTLQLQIIFGHSRKLYLGADAMAQVYSNARTALDQIEKDVANAVKSDQMEFFNDNRTASVGLGHYNPPGEKNGSVSGKLEDLPGRYIHSLLVEQAHGYEPKDAEKLGFGGGAKLRHDTLYFRTFTTIEGTPREALVEYKLWAGNNIYTDPRQRPVLQRIVTGPKINPATGQPQYDPAGHPIYERQAPQDVCYYVQEFKVELFIRDKSYAGRLGRFYSPESVVVPRAGDPRPATLDDAHPPALPDLLSGQDHAIECLDGTDDYDPRVVMKSDGRLHLNNGDRLAQLGPGDRLYCISNPAGGATQIDFNNAYLTIKEILAPQTGGGETVVLFEEETEVRRIMGTNAQLEVAYRGAWLPQAIRVQMKIKDQRSSEIRTMSRIFRLLRA